MADTGIKDSVEVVKAMGEAAVVMYRAVTAMKALPPETATPEKIKTLAQSVAGQLMSNPESVKIFEDAFKDVGNVLAEMRGLGLATGAQLALTCGQVIVDAATRVQQK
jgi:hypothetical protein